MSTQTARLCAQEGQRERCDRCGRVVEFRVIAHDALDGHPVLRWVAVRRTKLAPIPVNCPNTERGRNYHRAVDYSVTGAPLDA